MVAMVTGTSSGAIASKMRPEPTRWSWCSACSELASTGGSLGAAIEFLFRRGAQDVTAICLLGAPEGVAAIERQVEGRDVTLVLGAMDERLNEKGYIVPGLGDAGDRLYGTV